MTLSLVLRKNVLSLREAQAAEVRARGLTTSVTCECCFFGCPFCIVWNEIYEERHTNAEEPNHD